MFTFVIAYACVCTPLVARGNAFDLEDLWQKSRKNKMSHDADFFAFRFSISSCYLSVSIFRICDTSDFTYPFSTNFRQGVPGMLESLASTKTLSFICDIEMGRHLYVPAFEKLLTKLFQYGVSNPISMHIRFISDQCSTHVRLMFDQFRSFWNSISTHYDNLGYYFSPMIAFIRTIFQCLC